MAFENVFDGLASFENIVTGIASNISDYEIRTITGLIPNLFLQHGWASTMYLVNILYLPGILEFSPPSFGSKTGITNKEYEEIYSPNYSFPVGRKYKSPQGTNNSNTQSGYFKMLRGDFLQFMRFIETEGGVDDINMTITEVIASLRAEPTVNSITVYKNVKVKQVTEDTRKQGDPYFTAKIDLIFTERPRIFTLIGEV